MLEVIRNHNGNIKGCCEWYLVNERGEFDNQGEFIWINECEISRKYRNNGLLKEFARIIMRKCPQAKFGYFWRKVKYPDRKPRIYHRARWLKLTGGI